MKNARTQSAIYLCLLLAGSLFGQQAAEPASSAVAASGAAAQAAVPRLIKFNGALRDLAGKPITGPVDVTFSLYSQEAGGNALWFETQTVQADGRGNYTVLLGAMSPSGVPMELFTSGEAHWLGVQAANLPEQSRVLLVSVPYAMKAGDAETLGGKPASAYQLSSQADAHAAATAATLSGMIASGATATTETGGNALPQSISTSGTANYIAGWASDGTTLGTTAIFQDPVSDYIGIATNTPAYGLDVNTNVFAVGPKAPSPGSGGTMRFRDDSGTLRWIFGMPGSVGATDFFMYNNVSGQAPFYVEGNAPSYGMYLKANGNVGIGTSNPGAKLEVNGTAIFDQPVTFASGQTFPATTFTGNTSVQGNVSASGQLVSTVATGTAPLQVASTTQVPNLNASILGGLAPSAFALVGAPNNFIGSQSIAGNLLVGTGTPLNIPLEVRVGGVPALTVGPTGIIGIATSSPAYGLDVGRSVVAIGPTTTGQGSGGTIRFRDDSGTLRWLFGIPGTAGSSDFFMYNNVNGAAPIYVKGGAPSYRLYMDSSGNVGIGTTTPSATLEVNGSAQFDGTVNFTGTQTFSGTNVFTGTQTITNGNLALPPTTSSTVGVLSIGGAPFAHSYGASSNTFVGRNAGNFSMTGAYNTGLGSLALLSNGSGASNTATGWSALVSNTLGSSNTASGYSALYSNNAGANNTAVGSSALFNNTDAGGNTAVGFGALLNNCIGAAIGCTAGYNTAVGYNAGVTSNISNANKSGTGDTFLGAGSGPASTTQLNNSTAVGANAVVGASNALVLGSISGVNGATASVKVGIGTATPSAALHVADGDVYASQAGTGIIVKSPDGSKCARIGIDNSGAITVSALACP